LSYGHRWHFSAPSLGTKNVMIAGMLLQFTVVLVWHFSAPSLGSKNVNDRMLLQLINPCLSMNIAGTFSAPSLGLKKHDILIAGTFQHLAQVFW